MSSSFCKQCKNKATRNSEDFTPAFWKHSPVSRCFKPFPFLALEYCGSSLFSLLGEKGAFSVDDSRAIALQLKAAVRGLHSLQILHLDLKTSNVLWCVVRRELKLADFGMSEYIPGYGPSIRFPMCNSKLPSPRIVARCSKGPFQVVGACSRFMVVWLCSL